MVLLGAATGVVLVHLNRAWKGPGADGPAGETSDRDRRSGFSDTEPRQRPPPPYPPPPSPPPAPPALPIEDREYKSPWGYFDPLPEYGFAPMVLAAPPRRFGVGTVPGVEFNPSLARLPPGIAATLSSELGLREGKPKPVYVVMLKCKDGVCGRLRNKNRTFPGNGGFCRGSGGAIAVNCALLDEDYNTVAVAQPMASFPTKEARDVRIETHGDRIYASHLQPHSPNRWCLSELSFSFNGTRTDTYGSQRDPQEHRKSRQPPGKLLVDMMPIRHSKVADDPLDLCAVGARNIAPIWHGGGIYFVHWLAEPFMLLGDLGVDRVWEERPVPPGRNPEGSLLEPKSFNYASTFTGPAAKADTALALYRHEGEIGAKAPFSYLRGVGERRLHSNGFALPLPDGKRLLMMGHIHTDLYTPGEQFMFGNTYINYFVLVDSTPPFKFLAQSPPFCFPSADNSSECESIQFVMTARVLPTGRSRSAGQGQGRPANDGGGDGDISDPAIQFSYGINDCSGATVEMPLSDVLAYTYAKAPGAATGKSDDEIAQMFGATVGDPDAYAAVQSCATSSSRVDGVRRLNPRTGADDPANGDWFCRCRTNHSCAGRGCPGADFRAGAGTAWFATDCGACKLWCKSNT